jgi:TRAP-type mannitol/chloroaromatic compound transport system substrate-binding protein
MANAIIDPPPLVGLQSPKKISVSASENVKRRPDHPVHWAVPTRNSRQLSKGTVDISYTSSVYYTGTVPEANIDLVTLPPQILKTEADARQVYWYSGVDELMREGYKEYGVYYLGSLFFTDPNTFWSKKPIKGVDDLKGFKVRGYGYYARPWQNFWQH